MRERSFMESLFFGVVDEPLLFESSELPGPELDRLHPVLDAVRLFFEQKVDSASIDREANIPEDVTRGLKDLGCFGWLVPQAFGGAGFSATAYARALQEVASLDASVAVTLGAHQSLGLAGLVLFGSDAEKKRLLPRLARGELVAAFALTEAGAGSDPATIQTRAERRADGGFVLRGRKEWITNGASADLFTVFARTSIEEEGAKPHITAFLVERGPGVESGPNQDKLGIRGSSTTYVAFKDVAVPAGNVLGEVGRGFNVAMQVLNGGRLGLAAGCIGLCRRALKLAIDRCKERRAFGRSIGEFGLVKDKIAAMMSETWALESVTYLTTGIVDRGGLDFSIESAICKVFGSETCWRVVNECLQIAAGAGYMKEFPYERLLRDARVNLIFEGTNEVLRAFIALRGMQGPGRGLAGFEQPPRRFTGDRLGLLTGAARSLARSALGRGRMTGHAPALAPEAAVVERYAEELARSVERVLRKHGRDIAEMQYTQKRAADLAIDLCAVAACVARASRAVKRRGEEGARREIDLTRIFVHAAEHRLKQTVAEIQQNDDELRKAVAIRAYADGAYPLDID